MARNIGNPGQVGGQQPLPAPQPHGPLAQHGVQPGQPRQHRNAVNLGQQPPVWQQPVPPHNPLQGLQPVLLPVNVPPLPPLLPQIGGYNLPNAPALQNVQRLPQPTLQPSPAVSGALANLVELSKLINDADNIVQATHTDGSKRFEPVEALLKQAEASSFDQAPFRELGQAASDYVAERGTESRGGPFNRHQAQVARPQAHSARDVSTELARPTNDSTARKLMVADFIVQQVGTLQASNTAVMQVFYRARQGIDAGVARDLAAIAAHHPTGATKRMAADELLSGLAALNGVQLGQFVQQAGLGTVDAILHSLSNQLPRSPQRDQVIDRLATAIASNGPLADAYVQNGQSAEVIDKVINGRGGHGYLTPLATAKDMIARQFAFELPAQNDQTLFRGNTPASRMLTAGLERAGQGHLAGIAAQIEAIVRQEVAQAGAGATVASQGTTVGNPVVADRILQRVMPLLDPQQTPQELSNFTRFVRGGIDQAPNLGGGGADFVRNAVMLRAVNGMVVAAIHGDPNATAAEKAVATTVTGTIQRALSANGSPFPPHHKEAGMNNWVQTMAQPNSQLNQWLGGMT